MSKLKPVTESPPESLKQSRTSVTVKDPSSKLILKQSACIHSLSRLQELPCVTSYVAQACLMLVLLLWLLLLSYLLLVFVLVLLPANCTCDLLEMCMGASLRFLFRRFFLVCIAVW